MTREAPESPIALLGHLLQEARAGVQRSPEQVANLVGVAGKTIRRLEEGEVGRPRSATLEALCRYYGLDTGFLLEILDWDERGGSLARRLGSLYEEQLGRAAPSDEESDPVALGMALARRLSRRTEEAPPVLRRTPEAQEVLSGYERLDPRRRVLLRALLADLDRAHEFEASTQSNPRAES
jgi:transcriptional regulator with XRE-family HTH domain